MVDVAEERLRALREKRQARMSAAVDASTSMETSPKVYEPKLVTPRLPQPRQVYKRLQTQLRPDQVARLAALKRRFPGTSRNDFIREAVDLYLELMDDVLKEKD